MAEPAPSDSSPDTDREFDPSADMLVHDFDDEGTMEEEEALSNADSVGNELSSLEKEGDMPIEDLLAMYYGGQTGPPAAAMDLHHDNSTRSSSEEEILSNQDLTLDKEEIARDLLKHDDGDDETSVHELLDSVEMPSQTIRLLRSSSQPGSSDEESMDNDYEPPADDDWKKSIQVGSDYQATVPQTLCKYGDAPAYENEDRLLWCPFKLQDSEVESYLRDIQTQSLQDAQGVQAMPQGPQVRDDEQALYLLLQCGHNIEEASRRRKMQTVPPSDPMSLWSEEECRNFENGLKQYGKDFYLIQQNKVKTRSVGELVQFYYLWKKTERHDVFANKTRLEKKKYALHPGVTDYMDRFLDEQENPAPARDRSSSPNINSLLYGDPKRHLTDYREHVTDLDVALDMVQKVVDTNALALSPLKLHAAELHHVVASYHADAGSGSHPFASVGFHPISAGGGGGDLMLASSGLNISSAAMTCVATKPVVMPVLHHAHPSPATTVITGSTDTHTDSIDSKRCLPDGRDGSESINKRLKTDTEWSVNNSSNSVTDSSSLSGDSSSPPQLCPPSKINSDIISNNCTKLCSAGDGCLDNVRLGGRDLHAVVDGLASKPSPVITKDLSRASVTIGLSSVSAALKTDFSSVNVRASTPPQRSIPAPQESTVQ